MKTRYIVDAIIVNENKVLLLKRSNNKRFLPGNWDLPGGKVEENEDPNNAIKREVKEETSLTVSQAIPKYTWSYKISSRTDELFQVTNYLVTCTNYDKILVRKEEHTEFKWFTLEEIETLENFSDSMKLAIKNTLEKM